jgi:hypothetical protein
MNARHLRTFGSTSEAIYSPTDAYVDVQSPRPRGRRRNSSALGPTSPSSLGEGGLNLERGESRQGGIPRTILPSPRSAPLAPSIRRPNGKLD